MQGDKKATLIIDRTLPEIYRPACKMSRLDILDYCWLQKDMGVDIIELDAGLVRKIGKLPEGLDFILRISAYDDIKLCIRTGIKRCVMRRPLLEMPGMAGIICANKLEATLEVSINTLKGIDRLEQIKGLESFDALSSIRVSGLSHVASYEWVDSMERIKNKLRMKMDICPENRFCLGTAAALEAVESGYDYVTASFAGYGRKKSYTPLEELLAAMKVLLGKLSRTDLCKLPELSGRFKKFSQRSIPDNKAIIGRNIFKYESGIHAGGIEKDPRTYEPFDPAIVGQQRSMAIGKHSGRSSVRKKLLELGLEGSSNDVERMLEQIREKSIQKGSDLSDDELVCLFYKNFKPPALIPRLLKRQNRNGGEAYGCMYS